MHRVERLVYDMVKSNAQLKMRVRDAYQLVCDLIPVSRNRTAYPLDVREGYFFGFHDKCPWSADGRNLLAHRYLIPLRMPQADDLLEVGYFDEFDGKVFHSVSRTRAWNWHQGAQLQWLGDGERIVFNDFDGEKHVTRVVGLDGALDRILPRPVAALAPDGSYALSYSFARLRGTPFGYAYANGVDEEADKRIPQMDGLWLMDTVRGNAQRLFTVAEVARLMPEPSMEGAFHYFSHCQFSPAGRRFKFFHRWTVNSNRQWTRMLSADVDGGHLHIFPTSGMVSHVAWRTDKLIVAYASTVEHGDAYYEFRDCTNEFRVIGRGVLCSDGHPEFSRDGNWMLTDTYADRFRRRFLVLYDIQQNKRHDLAMLYSPKEFAGVSIADHLQCDLHPRWNRSDKQVCFDSAHTGSRALCVMTVEGLAVGRPRAP